MAPPPPGPHCCRARIKKRRQGHRKAQPLTAKVGSGDREWEGERERGWRRGEGSERPSRPAEREKGRIKKETKFLSSLYSFSFLILT